jgi:hypothetical protein
MHSGQFANSASSSMDSNVLRGCIHLVALHGLNVYSGDTLNDGNFLLLRPYHGEHGPKVPVTPKYIVLQRVPRKRECMSILTKMSIQLISND